jgi:hypothetical protein
VRRPRSQLLYHSNSEQEIKYPQRGHTSLQCLDSNRIEQTGQNWTGNSGGAGASWVLESGWLIPTLLPSRGRMRGGHCP